MWSPVQDGNIEGLELTSSHGRTKTTVTPKQFPLEENQKSGEQLLHIRQTRKKKKKLTSKWVRESETRYPHKPLPRVAL